MEHSQSIYIILLSISILAILSVLRYILKKNIHSQLQKVFAINFVLLFILCFFILLQILFSEKYNIPPIYFDYLAYIGGFFLPVSVFFSGMIFANTRLKFKKRYLLVFIIPITSLLLLWTNAYHSLFFVNYAIFIQDVVYGKYFAFHTLYSYAFFFLAILYFFKYSIKNSGFFSKQSMLIFIGTLIPLVINILGTFKIINMTIYVTPISFVIAVIFYALAIFKYQFLTISPIALQKIVDRMSDNYIVLNTQNIIIDFNAPFLETFNISANRIRNENFFELPEIINLFLADIETVKSTLEKIKDTKQTVAYEKYFSSVDKYFNIEINNIISNKTFLGTLILLKDITQHVNDLATIQSNQDLLVEKERLASLGQLVGGIAHNLKTPIMSIAGASEGIKDLLVEYDASISDPEVTIEDHKEIIKEMNDWLAKIKTHIGYMSDAITAIKGQAVDLSNSKSATFAIEELIKYINVLMKHELNQAHILLNVVKNTADGLMITTNINILVQVVNNIISNAIQAYAGKPDAVIDLIFENNKSHFRISVKDYGPGISPKVRDKLFNSMITTKGQKGSGLGLFMSYSNVKAHLNGNLSFESELGEGTTFQITIPLKD